MGRSFRVHGGVVAVLVGLTVLLAFAVRSLPVASAFPGDGSVILEIADGSYHARRALFTFVNFPSILFFDPYLNHPDGSPVPWPPLYDLALATVARLLGDSLAVFERTAAWASPALGALTVLPVYVAGRSLGGAGLALGAGSIFALLWAGAFQASVGNPDHHAAASLLGATLLAITLTLVHPDARGRHRVLLWLGWPLARAALVLSWAGSLLYLGLAEGAALLAAVVGGRRDLFAGQALGCLIAAALVTPWIVAGGTPTGGAFSTFTLSWFHVTALAAVAMVAGGMAVFEAVRPSEAMTGRVLRALVLALAASGLLLVFPGVREALAPSVAFLAKQDAWASSALIESRSLFGGTISGAQLQSPSPTHFYGWFAYLLPLALLATLLRGRERCHREPALCLSVWLLVLGPLAIGEIRFSGDFAPAASLSFALLLAEVGAAAARRFPRTTPAVGTAAVVAGVLLLWPSIALVHAPMLRQAIDHLRAPDPARIWRGPYGSLVQFARTVRDVTPDTAGFYDPTGRPEYGILAAPGLGHVLHYVARRATPADNFGPYLDADKLAAVRSFFASTSESDAVEIASELGAGYVLTAAYRGGRGLEAALHDQDGMPSVFGTFNRRFRLITEGPKDGKPLFPVSGAWRLIGLVPYKLFEIVEGAVLEVHTRPHAATRAELHLVTPIGRRFDYRLTAAADVDGVAHLRVAYPTETDAPTRAEGPYRVRADDREFRVHVSEAEVRTGARVRVGAPGS